MSKNKEEIKELLKKVNALLKELPQEEMFAILGTGIMNDFLEAIAPLKGKEDIYQYLLKNKQGLTILALMRLAIHMNYSIKGIVNDKVDVFISPLHYQWFENGIMFMQGKERFEGLIGLYHDGKVQFAVSARDAKKGEDLGPEDFLFIDIEKAQEKLIRNIKGISDLDDALQYLKNLLDNKEDNEEKYQKFFTEHPWIFGAQYEKVDSHKKLNDENIPDFTGVRIKDKHRDVIEIKQPFLDLFKKENQFNSNFNDAWNQIEKYLDFVVQNSDHLYREKRLLFDNPQCFILVGYNLSDEQIKSLHTKERRNPSIRILTYNDVLAMGKATRDFFNNIKLQEEVKKRE